MSRKEGNHVWNLRETADCPEEIDLQNADFPFKITVLTVYTCVNIITGHKVREILHLMSLLLLRHQSGWKANSWIVGSPWATRCFCEPTSRCANSWWALHNSTSLLNWLYFFRCFTYIYKFWSWLWFGCWKYKQIIHEEFLGVLDAQSLQVSLSLEW